MACGSLCSQNLFSRFPVPVSTSFSSSSKPRRAVTGRTSAARLPVPPLNPKDPFLSKLAWVAASQPEALAIPRKDSDTLPYVDLLGLPKLMVTSDQLERSAYGERRPRTPPPDLPSLLLSGRIVYIGMPLVPAVTELVVAELMYLHWMDPKQPIYIYINSTGTTRDDGQPLTMNFRVTRGPFSNRVEAVDRRNINVYLSLLIVKVAMESQGFAIYGALRRMKSEIYTLCLGIAAGQACLLLAAGTKGKRFMMPRAYAMLQQPRIPSYGTMQASDIAVRAKEIIHNRDTLVQLLAKHTGNPIDVISQRMRRRYHMDAEMAKEFGVIDRILQRDEPKVLKKPGSLEKLDKRDTRFTRGL